MDARSFHASKARASNAPLTRRELLERDLPAQATGELKILLECWNREGGGRPPRSIQLACSAVNLLYEDLATLTASEKLPQDASLRYSHRQHQGQNTTSADYVVGTYTLDARYAQLLITVDTADPLHPALALQQAANLMREQLGGSRT